MRVVCIFPITNNEKNIPTIIEKFRDFIAPQLSVLGATNIELKFAGADYIFVRTEQVLEVPKGKGKGILDCLKNVAIVPDFVIACDGSGAIPFEYIIDIFKVMISDSTMACVMANRKDNKAINDSRYLIERFEIFSIIKLFNHKKNIPDGQCGLWGYRNGKLKINNTEVEIKLSSVGYEIELDLVSEIIEKNLEYSFVDINLPPRQVSSSFGYNNNLKKFEFIISKYPKLKFLISYYLNEYEKTNEFNDLINKHTVKETWKRYKEDVFKIINKQI
jgi:hypothetical protein